MTAGDLITKLIEIGSLDAEVYLVSPGDIETVEDDLGQMIMLHGVDRDGLHKDSDTGSRNG